MSEQDLIELIEHDAVVKSIDRKARTVTVEITDHDECDQCPAARLCQASDKTTAIIPVSNVDSYKPGDNVIVSGTEQMHRKAILLATVIPCICLIAVMVLIYITTGSQLSAALGGLASMLFFFTALYMARHKIAHEFVFTIHHKLSSE